VSASIGSWRGSVLVEVANFLRSFAVNGLELHVTAVVSLIGAFEEYGVDS